MVDPEIIEEHHPGIGATLAGVVAQAAQHFPGVRLPIIARDTASTPGKIGVCIVSGDDDMDAVAATIANAAKAERGPEQ